MSTDVEIAWAAGLFEGEGSITSSTRTDGYVNFIALSMSMSDEDVMKRFVAIVGYETLCKYHYCANRKVRYQWQVNKYSEVVRIFMLLAPYLGNRRQAKGIELIKAYGACRERAS